MKLRLLVLLVPWFLWQCATPPSPSPSVPAAPLGVDDDHRAVGAPEFLASPWHGVGAVQWKAAFQGIELVLTDGRKATLFFSEPTLFRWWVPAAAGERALSPAARYQGSLVAVQSAEADGVVTVATESLGVKVKLADLSLTVFRADRTVFRTGGLRVAGRRLALGLNLADAAGWTGPGLRGTSAVRHWVDPTHPFAVPALTGLGGAVPFTVALDTGYQSYTALGADATIGTLNGGLDLVVSASPQPSVVVAGLTSVLGRPELPPQWAFGTGLVLPATESGDFVRRSKLPIETAVGPHRPNRPRFQSLVPAAAETVPDLTQADVRTTWSHRGDLVTLPDAAGVVLGPSAARSDWTTTFVDQGLNSLLARVGPRLPGLEAQAFREAARSRSPLLRPLVLAASGAPGLARYALAEFRPKGAEGELDQVLALSLAGQGTPSVRLDLSDLAQAETRAAAFGRLASWLWAPVLTLDWGPNPAAVWAGLGDAEKRTLKGLLDRRSQLKPYLAQVFRDTARTGRPAWAPVWFDAPGDVKALAVHDEYLLGTSLLAAPATGGSRTVYLPGPGVWFDFWTGEEYGGGKSYDVEVRPDRPLLFAPGGALVPVREPEVFDEKDVYNPMTVHVFPGGLGKGTYWVDDGLTVGYQAGAYQETRLAYEYAQKSMTLTHATASAARVKVDPYLLYRVHNVYKPRQVRIDGKAIPLFGDSWGITDTDRSAAWYESDHTLLIKTFHPEKDQTVEMAF